MLKSGWLIIIVVIILAEIAVCQQQPNTNIDANAYCFNFRNRRNKLNLYGYPDDCHLYLQCFFINEALLAGYVRQCQKGTYWDERQRNCVLEGVEKCSPHPCSLQSRSTDFGRFHMPGMPCNMFLLCGFNETRCCDAEQRFSSETGDCDYDPSCRDNCQPTPVFIPEPVRLTPTTCRDVYGNILTSQANPRKFYLADSLFECALGSQFDLETCRCNKPAQIVSQRPPRNGNMCHLWLPFDGNVKDQSEKHYETRAFNGARYDRTTAAHGNGSLRVIGIDSHLSIPGLRNVDLNTYHEVSWCYFFRCDDGKCDENGGILSNNYDEMLSDFSYIGAISSSGKLATRLSTTSNPGPMTFAVPYNDSSHNEWTQVCTVWEVAQVRTYINSELMSIEPATGNLTISNYPYVIGRDLFYGSFVGNIDEVLICNHAMTSLEISAHYNGNRSSLRHLGLIP